VRRSVLTEIGKPLVRPVRLEQVCVKVTIMVLAVPASQAEYRHIDLTVFGMD
jgi:hypothetical protein